MYAKHLRRNRFLILVAMIVATAAVSFAQTAVPITIDTNALFTSTNTWIASFTPVFGLVGGIAIALALLTFVTAKVVAAFRGGGAR